MHNTIANFFWYCRVFVLEARTWHRTRPQARTSCLIPCSSLVPELGHADKLICSSISPPLSPSSHSCHSLAHTPYKERATMDNDTLLAEEMQEQVRATQEIVRKVSLTPLPLSSTSPFTLQSHFSLTIHSQHMFIVLSSLRPKSKRRWNH